MKKHHFILFILYASIIIISIVIVVLDSLNLHLKNLITDFWMGEQFVFSIVFLILAVTILLLLLWVILDDNSKRGINQNLRRILNNQPITLDEDTEINTNLSRLSKKMTHLTNSLQNTENSRILNSQEIVEPDLGVQVLEENDYLIINSDGLTNMITNDEIVSILSQDKNLDDKNNELVTLANERGGLDNITIALIHAESEEA
jgi:hypothetical protein